MRRLKTELRRTVAILGVLLAAACSATPTVQAPPPAPTNVTVFEGARVIVGDGSPPIENAIFVVEDGRFRRVGRPPMLIAVRENAPRVDLRGKTVMPAIVDTHTHMPTTREALVERLQQKAYYGVGAVASLGQDNNDVAFQVRDEIVPNGALLRTAGRGITMPEPGRTEAPYWVTNEAEARKAVQELAARKVDLVKIWVDDRDGKYKKLGPALYGAIIDEAHKHGLRVTAHIFALEDAKGLLRAGLDAFAHSVRDRDIDDEGLALFKQHANLVVAPNLPDRGVATDMSWLSDSIPPGELKKLQAAATDRPDAQKAYGIQARNLAKIHAAGVNIVLGTDGGIPWSHHVEMADMVAAGMSPSDVIVAATKNSAEFLRLNDAGTIAEGKRADFLVLDANPLDDITNTRKISSMYLRGAAIDRDAIRARMTPPAAQPGVAYVHRDTVNAALAKGGVLVERPQVRVAGGHRDKPGALETSNGTTILYINDGEGAFAAGARTQVLTKGDVIVVPAGTAQSFTSVASPISYLQIVVPVIAEDAKADLIYVPHEKVAATLKKAGPLADGPNLRVSGGFRPFASRDASPVAEVHANEADLFYVIEGRATQVLGGSVVGGKETGPGQIRGPKTEGGQTYQLGKGDVMWVPAGMPHWFPEIPEALSYLLVKVFY